MPGTDSGMYAWAERHCTWECGVKKCSNGNHRLDGTFCQTYQTGAVFDPRPWSFSSVFSSWDLLHGLWPKIRWLWNGDLRQRRKVTRNTGVKQCLGNKIGFELLRYLLQFDWVYLLLRSKDQLVVQFSLTSFVRYIAAANSNVRLSDVSLFDSTTGWAAVGWHLNPLAFKHHPLVCKVFFKLSIKLCLKRKCFWVPSNKTN